MEDFENPPFDTDKDITKFPRQIYRRRPEVPSKSLDSRKIVIEFYTDLFKYLSPMFKLKQSCGGSGDQDGIGQGEIETKPHQPS